MPECSIITQELDFLSFSSIHNIFEIPASDSKSDRKMTLTQVQVRFFTQKFCAQSFQP